MTDPKPTPVGKYIDLYREHCATTPMLNNQECEVIERLAAWAREMAERKLAIAVEALEYQLPGKFGWRNTQVQRKAKAAEALAKIKGGRDE